MSDNAFDIDDILNEISKRHESREQTESETARAPKVEPSARFGQEHTTNNAEKAAEEKRAERSFEREAAPVRPAQPRHAERETAPVAAWERAYLDSVKDRRINPKPEKETAPKKPHTAESAPTDNEKLTPPQKPEIERPRFENTRHASEEQDPTKSVAKADESYFEAAEKLFAQENVFGEKTPAEAQSAPDAKEEIRRHRADKKENGGKRKKSKKSKVFLVIILILIIAIIGTGVGLFLHFNNILNNITNEEDKNNESSKLEEWTGMDNLVVNFNDIYETTDVSSYRDMVRKWYYNGEPASSSNIYNVMLIGEDTRGDDIETEGTRADSAIIASVNTETGELVLSSILRDSYVYYEEVPGDESTGRYSKITEAMMYGGLDCYINAVERVFKVNIDNYAIVNFASFKTIIDSLGGVDIEVTAREIREINNHPKRYGDVYIEGDAGLKHLDGTQALAYCRIRYIDDDTVRADRQKTTLLNIFNKLKEASAVQIAGVVTNLLPYVKTGFSRQEILSIGEYAIKHGWLGYNLVTYTTPTNETRPDGTVITTCTGGSGYNFYQQWCWKLDLPLASQALQEKIYGKTNVVLADNRPNFRELSPY